MKALLCILALALNFSVFAKGKKTRKTRISFKKIGQVVQSKDANYKIDLKVAEPRIKLTQFCSSDIQRTNYDKNGKFSNCLDDSRPASTERQREQGFSIQIQ